MLYGEIRKILDPKSEIELAIFDSNSRVRVYKVCNTRKFDTYKIMYLNSQNALLDNKVRLCADILSQERRKK